VTFLFTDIEGSTALARSLGSRWLEIVERHNAILRAAIHEHGGIDVRTEGDSFFAVFSSATGAVSAAADAQRALFSQKWPSEGPVRVRMGVHSGEGRLGGDDYVGLDVHRAARIAAAGHGGQVLLSESTRALVEDHLADGTSVRKLGEYRLKDFAIPQRLNQLVIGGLPAEFPPLRTLDVRSNLPTQLTSFVGRERELTELDELLARTRLLTLTGPGGTGKTRLAVEAARARVDDYPDGVAFVDLSPIKDPELVPSAIVQALELKEQLGRPALDTLKAHLVDRRILLVLDNFEQVGSAAPVVAELLQAAPRIGVLVTSRIRLDLLGEQAFLVPPLDLPGSASDLEVVSRNEAVALFRERARAVAPAFDVTPANAEAVAQICMRVDGLPLAIELAAAQLRLFSPSELLAHLRDGLRLATGAVNVPERQRTLRGAIEWSYQLLGERERRLFARLSVFRGGATAAAIDAVCNPDGDLGIETTDALGSLLDHSLVKRLDLPDGSRFTMLATIREHADERLRSEFDAAPTERRHAEFFAAHAERWGPGVRGHDPLTAFTELSREYENVRGAVDWSLRERRADVGLRIAAAMWMFWVERGPVREGRRAAESLLKLPSAAGQSGVRAAGLDALGSLAYWEADYEVSHRAYTEALQDFREMGDARRSAETLLSLAYVIGASMDPADAIPLMEEARDLARGLGDQLLVARALSALGIAQRHVGQPQLAIEALQEARVAFEAIGDRYWLNQTLSRLGSVYLSLGRLEQAEEFLRRSLAETAYSPGFVETGANMWILATVAFERGQFERALRLIGFSEGLAERSGSTPPGILLGDQVSHFAAARARLGPETVDRLRAEGRSMSVEEAIAYARGEPG
jgi:predicted ATPase/class 3 adenylate cyclase